MIAESSWQHYSWWVKVASFASFSHQLPSVNTYMKSHSPREGEEKEDHQGEGREVGDEETSQQSWHSSHTQHHCKYLL